MKTLIQSLCLFVFFVLIFSSPVAAAYYDQNGVKVEKDQYDKIVQSRAADINKVNKQGYGESSSRLEDPVRLRNKRIEQWRSQSKKGPAK